MKKFTSLLVIMLLILTMTITLSSCDTNSIFTIRIPTNNNPNNSPIPTNNNISTHEHQWEEATCTEPKQCKTCNETDGKPTGHTESEWTLTQEATLVNEGIEKLYCSKCKEVIDNRSVAKKVPQVKNTHFNFTDKELIDWINDISTVYVSYTELGLDGLSSANTSYRVTMSDGEKGAFILNHDDSGNICAIMVYFDDWQNAAALAIWTGEKIDSDFSSDDAFYPIANDESYTAASMTVMRLNLDVDFEVTVLAPTDFFDSILS